MVKQGNISIQYLFASLLMLVFVLNDLAFDFLFTFTGSNYVSFTFTILVALLTFVGNYGVVKFEITHKTDKISLFVRSNFNLPQAVFSILDIFCGLVSIFSGLIFVGSIFKIARVIYIPLRFVTLANKGKSIFKAVSKFSLIWVIGRLLTNKYKGVDEMLNWIKNNKMTLAYCIVLGPLGGFVSYKLLPLWLEMAVWANVLLAIFVGFIVIFLTVLLGGDKTKPAVFRFLAKALSQENYNIIKEEADKLLAEQEIHEEAIKVLQEREKAEKQAQINSKVQMTEEERQARIEAEILKIKNGQN